MVNELARLPRRIIAGGQTGVDRAALDWAIDNRIEHGGRCQEGRHAEDGEIPPHYLLKEIAGSRLGDCVLQNILDSDATLILNVGTLDGSPDRTLREARQADRPCLLLQIDEDGVELAVATVCAFLATRRQCVLHVTGPSESSRPGIGALARCVLDDVVVSLRRNNAPGDAATARTEAP